MILVTGGTGLVGSHLLFVLAQKEQHVRAIHRKKSHPDEVLRIFEILAPNSAEAKVLFSKIEWMEADVTDVPALEIAFEGISEVYHSAAYVSFNPSKYNLLKKTNIEGTANVVNCCLHFGIKKLCHVSSVATLSKKPNELLMDENSHWNPDEKNSMYAISKYGAEMEVWRGAQEGLNVVVVNPGVILGISPKNGGSGFIENLGSRNILFYPSGTVGVVDVRDVVEIMVLLMKSKIVNERFILVSKNISYKFLLSEIASIFQKNPPKRKLSKNFMTFLSKLDSLSHTIFRTKIKIPKDAVNSMFKSLNYDESKVVETLNYNFIPLKDTLKFIKENQSKR